MSQFKEKKKAKAPSIFSSQDVGGIGLLLVEFVASLLPGVNLKHLTSWY